jgi:hypothetical protein
MRAYSAGSSDSFGASSNLPRGGFETCAARNRYPLFHSRRLPSCAFNFKLINFPSHSFHLRRRVFFPLTFFQTAKKYLKHVHSAVSMAAVTFCRYLSPFHSLSLPPSPFLFLSLSLSLSLTHSLTHSLTRCLSLSLQNNLINRVTRMGEFSPIGDCLLWTVFLTITDDR